MDAKMTSIIMTAYCSTQHQAHLTMAAIANIVKYTDLKDYELIVIDGSGKYKIRDDYKVWPKNTKIIINNPDIGYTASMNQGAKLAKGERLVFIQNDVFVWEGWLEVLISKLNEGYEAVFPDQIPRRREEVLRMGDESYGSKDAGLLLITKEAFERTGGWNEKLSLLAEKDFYQRMAKAGVKETTTNKVLITHITQGTNDEHPPERWHKRMDHDANILNR